MIASATLDQTMHWALNSSAFDEEPDDVGNNSIINNFEVQIKVFQNKMV